MEKTWLGLLKEPLERYEEAARQKFEAATRAMVMDDPVTAVEKAKDLITEAAKYQAVREVLATYRQVMDAPATAEEKAEEYFEKIKKAYQELKSLIDWGMDVRDEAEVHAKFAVYAEVVEKVFSLIRMNDPESWRVYKIEFRVD